MNFNSFTKKNYKTFKICKFILLQNPFERDAIPFTAEGDFFILQIRKKLIQQRNLVNF